jgi:hypothetical protein
LGADDEGREVGDKPEITASGTPGILGVNYLPPLADGEPYQVMKMPLRINKGVNYFGLDRLPVLD